MQNRRLSVLSMAIVVAGANALSPDTGARTVEEPKNVADVPALVEAHNRVRAAEKLGPLKVNPKLEAAALAHARDMAQHKKLTHEGSDGSTPEQRIEREGYHYQAVAENVAYGTDSVAEVMRIWMESPPHKKNILGDFTEIGVACVKAEDGTPYWAVDFGKPMPRLDPDRAATEVVDLLNRERKKAGKPSLKLNPKLTDAARRHAQDMAAHDEFRAKDDDGLTPFERIQKSGYRFKRLGEASLKGQPTAADAVESWLKEPSNRERLLGDYKEVGVGYATNEKGIPYWSLVFAEPLR
jgi:uncharacterized protein YkwD